MEIISPVQIDVFVKLIIAIGLGLLLGVERIMAGKSAGIRTYAMVSMTSAFFIAISQIVTFSYIAIPGFDFDPMRLAAQIVVGVGFLGAGLIIFKDDKVQNLTTASGLWTSSAIGMAVGFGLYVEALFATLLTLFVMGVLSKLEHKARSRFHW